VGIQNPNTTAGERHGRGWASSGLSVVDR